MKMRQKEELERENQELKLELERSRLMPKRDHKPVGASVDEVENHFLCCSWEVYRCVL